MKLEILQDLSFSGSGTLGSGLGDKGSRFRNLGLRVRGVTHCNHLLPSLVVGAVAGFSVSGPACCFKGPKTVRSSSRSGSRSSCSGGGGVVITDVVVVAAAVVTESAGVDLVVVVAMATVFLLLSFSVNRRLGGRILQPTAPNT